MNAVAQILAIVATNLRNIPHRLGSSLVIVIGIAGVVGVLIPVLAMSLGVRARRSRAMVAPGSRHRALAYRHGGVRRATSRENAADKIMNAPEVRRDARGESIVSGEVVLVAPVSRKRDHADVNVTLRGRRRASTSRCVLS